MTFEEKRTIVDNYCRITKCSKCKLVGKWDHLIPDGDTSCLDIGFASEEELDRALVLIGEGNVITDDPVNHPSHYTKGKIEVADFIADQKLNFDRGNAVKYVCRAGSKDPSKEIKDLEKAIWYINHEIKTLKGENEDAT